MKKLPVIAIALLVATGCGTGSPGMESRTPCSEKTEDSHPDRKGEGRLTCNGGPWANNIGRYDEVFNDSNYIQYQSAENWGIDPIYTVSDAYNTRRPLVKIESGEYYQLDNLTHSMPFLVPEAASLLDEIGKEFGDVLEERGGEREYNRLIVTSLLRSPYTVRKLRRVNRNAVDSSTHMFATTFDIAYNNFYYPDSLHTVNSGVLKGILAEVLLKKREEGKCWVKYEKKTPCFHITVR